MPKLTLNLPEDVLKTLSRFTSAYQMSKDDLVTHLILVMSDFNKLRDAMSTSSTTDTSQTKNQVTRFEREVADLYADTFQMESRPFWPALMRTVRTALSGGLTEEDIRGVIRVAPQDPWVQQLVKGGDPPRVHQLLSANMIDKLLPLYHRQKQAETVDESIRLDGSVKPRALSTVKEFASKDIYAKAYDLINAAPDEEQVNAVVAAVVNNQFTEYVESLGMTSE